MLSNTESDAAQSGGSSAVPWSPWTALQIWVVAFLASLVWITLLVATNGTDTLPRTVPWIFAGQLALWAAYGLGPIVVARRAGGSLTGYFPVNFETKHLVFGLLGGLLFQVVVIPLVYVPLGSLIDSDQVGEVAEELIETAGSGIDVVLLFIMIVLIAPVVEELFFRGMVLPSIMDRLGAAPAVVLSSLWFAGSHLQAVQFPGLLAVGLALGATRVLTNSLVPAIALHMAFNGVTYGVLVSELQLS